MTDRAAQLEQVARRMFFEELPASLNSDENWRRHLIMFRAIPEMAPSMERAFLHAEIALSLAEETRREDVQRCRDLQAFGDAHEGNGNSKAWARAAESLANQMESTPIPIGDAGTGRVE